MHIAYIQAIFQNCTVFVYILLPFKISHTLLVSLSLTCSKMLVSGASTASQSSDPGESLRGSDAPRSETCAGELQGDLMQSVKHRQTAGSNK